MKAYKKIINDFVSKSWLKDDLGFDKAIEFTYAEISNNSKEVFEEFKKIDDYENITNKIPGELYIYADKAVCIGADYYVKSGEDVYAIETSASDIYGVSVHLNKYKYSQIVNDVKYCVSHLQTMLNKYAALTTSF